jgi:hypothetical protein
LVVQIWWGEATDEPGLVRQSIATAAREDARPTEIGKMYQHPKFKLAEMFCT